MQSSAAALELDFSDPPISAARRVAGMIADGNPLDRASLLQVMAQAHGAGAADGRWTLRDAYDVLELAQVLHLRTATLPDEPEACLAALRDLVDRLPTHSVRSEEQIALQQFSTPAPIAYFVALATQIGGGETVLEPSAGTGLLAVFAHRAGANFILKFHPQ